MTFSVSTSLPPQTRNEDAGVEIVLCTPLHKPAWDRYVDQHASGGFFHLFGWGEVIQSAYGYEPLYLAARRGGEIVGVLPLIDVRSPLLGRSLNSVAFTVGGGPLYDDVTALAALAGAAVNMGNERQVRYVELRTEAPVLQDWRKSSGKYAAFRASLPANEEENLQMIPRKRRAEIRKAIVAEKAGTLSIRYNADADEFYSLYAYSLRALGTPIYAKKFLHEILRVFTDKCEVSIVEHEGAAVASLVSFYFHDRVLPYYVGATARARAVRAHDYLYWSLMRNAAARGFTTFDFGRSKIDSGAFAYKKTWGIDPKPISYQFKLIGAKDVPDISPRNPKFSQFTRIWKRLPLPVTNVLGPILAPNFP